MKKNIFILLLAGLLFFNLGSAVEINPNIPGPNPTSTGPVGLIANIYSFALMIAGLLAFGAIVYGGIKYVISGSNPSQQGDAKAWITSALLGLFLLIAAALILRIINPDLVKLSLPGLTPLTTPSQTPSSPAPNTGGASGAW